MSLRTRLVLAISALAMGFCVLLIAIQIETTRRAVREEVEAANRIATQLLSRVAQMSGAQTAASLRQFLEGTGRIRANDLTLYDLAEEVIYRSPPSQYKADVEAPAWFAALVAPQAEPRVVDLPGGRLVVRPEASRAALDGWEDTRSLAGLSAAFVLVAALLVARLTGRLADRAEARLHESREAQQWLTERIEHERSHLARELHDEVAQSVTAIKSLALALPALRPEESARAARAIADGATTLYDSMQSIVTRLRPLSLDALGLEASLRDLVDQARGRPDGPQIELHIDEPADVPATLRLTVFRIAQEALTNSLRHARAGRIEIRLGVEHGHVRIEVNDDGCGLPAADPQPARRGFGLRGMRERVQAVGGRLVVEPAQAGGTRVRAELPLEQP